MCLKLDIKSMETVFIIAHINDAENFLFIYVCGLNAFNFEICFLRIFMPHFMSTETYGGIGI